MEQKLKDLKKEIFAHIKAQKVLMKPKWHFVLFVLLRVLMALIIFISIVYLASFISLVVREHELFEVFGLRPRGVRELMLAIPWLLVFLSTILIVILEILTRRFAFVYKRPVAYSMFALVFLVLGVGFVVYKVDKEFHFARVGECPDVLILGPIHRYYRGELEERPFVIGMNRLPRPEFNPDELKDFVPPFPRPVILLSNCEQ